MSYIGRCVVDSGCVEDTSFYFVHFLLLFLIFYSQHVLFLYFKKSEHISTVIYSGL